MFSIAKNIYKGIKGAAVGAAASAAAIFSTAPDSAVETVAENPYIDSVAVSVVEGDWSRAKMFAVAMVIGFVLESARNLIKNRAKL